MNIEQALGALSKQISDARDHSDYDFLIAKTKKEVTDNLCLRFSSVVEKIKHDLEQSTDEGVSDD